MKPADWVEKIRQEAAAGTGQVYRPPPMTCADLHRQLTLLVSATRTKKRDYLFVEPLYIFGYQWPPK